MPRPKNQRTWTVDEVTEWFREHMPTDWYGDRVTIESDRDEILVVGELRPDDVDDVGDARRCIAEFREETREQRIAVAGRAEALWGRKVSWAVRCGDQFEAFTTASVPVMTRLRLDERQVLDTLIDAGVARSRSDALAWCVRLVATNEAEWIGRLREAMTEVEKVRREGPAN